MDGNRWPLNEQIFQLIKKEMYKGDKSGLNHCSIIVPVKHYVNNEDRS